MQIARDRFLSGSVGQFSTLRAWRAQQPSRTEWWRTLVWCRCVSLIATPLMPMHAPLDLLRHHHHRFLSAHSTRHAQCCSMRIGAIEWRARGFVARECCLGDALVACQIPIKPCTLLALHLPFTAGPVCVCVTVCFIFSDQSRLLSVDNRLINHLCMFTCWSKCAPLNDCESVLCQCRGAHENQ